MASRDSIVRDLLEKLRDAPNDELSEVADFAEFLHAKRLKRAAVPPSSFSLDELEARAIASGPMRPPEPGARRLSTAEAPPVQVGGRPAASTPEERLRIAAEAGLITPPEPGRKRSSVTENPPVAVPGKSLSEIVLEDRR